MRQIETDLQAPAPQPFDHEQYFAKGGPVDEDTYGPSNIEERKARLEERLAAERRATAQYPGDELEAPKGYITPAKAVRWVDTDAGPMAVDAEGKSLPLIQQPGVLPLYRDPTIDSVRVTMPRVADITGDMIGAPLGMTARRVIQAGMKGERPVTNAIGSLGGNLYHGSPLKDLTELNPSARGPLGPGTYATPDSINIAKRYAGDDGKVYQLPREDMDIFRGAGHRTDAEYEGFKNDKNRLMKAVEPEMQDTVIPLIKKMWSGDGYPLYWSLRKAYGGDEGAQNLFKRAGFEGLSGQIDGPETLIFGKVSLKEKPHSSSDVKHEDKNGKVKSTSNFASGGRAVVGHETAAGLPVSLEEHKGEMRHRQDSGDSKMAADYGYIDSSKPDHDGMKTDAFVGPHHDSTKVFVINQQHPHTKKFNEHKVMLGYKDRAHALRDYAHSFSDGLGHKRIASVVEMDAHQLNDWVKKPHTQPVKKADGGGVFNLKESLGRLMKHV
jgi:hypothetical protein